MTVSITRKNGFTFCFFNSLINYYLTVREDLNSHPQSDLLPLMILLRGEVNLSRYGNKSEGEREEIL